MFIVFCSDVSGVNAFDDVAEKAHYYSHLDFVNDGKIKETFGPVRKRLNVPDEEDSDSNDFDLVRVNSIVLNIYK